MKFKLENNPFIALAVIVFALIILGIMNHNSKIEKENIRIENIRKQDSINIVRKKIAEQAEKDKIKVEKDDTLKIVFEEYIKSCKSKNYTCIKINKDAVYIIHSLTANNTKWEYLEVGKKKIIYKAELAGSLPFNINNMNLIGWKLRSPKGEHFLGAVAMNMETFRRGIVIYKNGIQQEYDEVK